MTPTTNRTPDYEQTRPPLDHTGPLCHGGNHRHDAGHLAHWLRNDARGRRGRGHGIATTTGKHDRIRALPYTDLCFFRFGHDEGSRS